MLQLPSFVRVAQTIAPEPPFSFSIPISQLAPLMEAQIYAPIENATTPRPIYPEQPSVSLTASIEARRQKLVVPRREPRSAPHLSVVRPIKGFALEVKE